MKYVIYYVYPFLNRWRKYSGLHKLMCREYLWHRKFAAEQWTDIVDMKLDHSQTLAAARCGSTQPEREDTAEPLRFVAYTELMFSTRKFKKRKIILYNFKIFCIFTVPNAIRFDRILNRILPDVYRIVAVDYYCLLPFCEMYIINSDLIKMENNKQCSVVGQIVVLQ